MGVKYLFSLENEILIQYSNCRLTKKQNVDVHKWDPHLCDFGYAVLIFMYAMVHYVTFQPQIVNKGTNINVGIYKNEGPSPRGGFII